ncbi:unnamed protein product, partial [Meganyctiphanes norvegica]
MAMEDTVEDLLMYKGLGCELASGGCSPTITEMTAAEAAALALEERPSSSMSTASRASGSTRIPRLNRRSSAGPKDQPGPVKDCRTNGSAAADGIFKSQSFVSSRGMKTASSPQSPSSPSNNSLQLPQTPNSARRLKEHMSPGSLTPDPQRRLSFTNHRRPSERKHNSYAGLGSPPWSTGGHSSGRHSFHSTLRRPNFLPLSQSTSNLYSGHSSMPVTPVSHPESPSRGTPESQDLDDVETASVGSCDSVSSAVSCDAGMARHHHHGHGKEKSQDRRYMLHCRHNHEPDPDSYLTPTQRAARKIRELKSQLAEARREVHVRDAEISRLTRELVELRLCKARSTQDDDKRKVEMPRENGDVSVDGTTPSVPSATPPHKLSATPSEGSEPELSRLMDNINSGLGEAAATSGTSPATASLPETTSDSVDLARSLADSGHYDDLTSPCLSSRDPFEAHRGFGAGSHRTDDEEEDRVRDTWAAIEETETRLRLEFDRREEELKRNHMNEYHELKEKHNDKVESLLSKLSDANLKYFELRPQYDHSQEKIRELEREVGRVKEELAEAERRHQKMYLQMFIKGQQAARMQQDDEHSIDSISMSESAVSVCELMKKLSHTEDELEKLKGCAPPLSPFPTSFEGPFKNSASNAALLDANQAISLYFQGRSQALNRREASSKNNNNLTTKNNNNNRELDPEVTLQFLKSAIYYFLTDKDNSRGHLRAIESILGYTDSEKCSIDKVVKI